MEHRHHTRAHAADRTDRLGDAAGPSITLLLLEWQGTGDAVVFEQVVERVRPHAERVAARTLRHHGLRDPDAVEETVALVLDHVRRLADSQGRERPVAKFVPTPDRTAAAPSADLGRSLVTCLAADRARDVARARRRQRSVPFSQLNAEAAAACAGRLVARDLGVGDPPPLDRVRAAAAHLEGRQRRLVELLLEGKSQAVVAHVLGVCEGTVSRLRVRAIATLQALLAE